ncbi:hypothetical protein BDZ89DRAFT_945114 [Hymenopellis radicata]|nr:hypothetical protein BDZ89DRAFT_945114 [Hymenopellis radicata]
MPVTPKSQKSADSDTTATNSSDEFNWDEDEADEQAKFEASKAKRLRLVYLAFMKLSRTVRTLLVGILGSAILITPLLVVELRFKSNSAHSHVFAWSLWFSIIWAAACITYLIVDTIPRLVIGIIVLLGGKVERFKFQLELALAVSGWLKFALDISWAWIALSIIRAVNKPPGSYWPTINQVMQALFSAAIILLVEKVFLQFVAINFHQKALAARLAENRLGLRALDRLSSAEPRRRHGQSKSTASIAGFGSMDLNHRRAPSTDLNHVQTHGGNSGASSVDPASGSANAAKADAVLNSAKPNVRKSRRKKAMATLISDAIGGAIGQVALKNSKLNRAGDMGSLHSARRLARKLFSALNNERDFLIVDDFYPYFRTTDEARDAFLLFDKDGNGDISKREMREAVQRIYRERKSLVSSMKDAGSAVSKLDFVCLGLCLVGIIFVCMLIFNKDDTLTSLVPLATIILGFSFIFGNSAATLFESMIFIFSTHVFDVGDLVMIDDQVLEVREFGMFSTVFRRVDGQEIVAPNSLLASSKLIHNLRRSNSMWETTNIQIAYNTPLEVIEEIRNGIKKYIAENNRDWSGMDLNIDKMEFQNAIHLIVAMEHRPNWQDWGGRWARRTKFMRNLKTILEDLKVRYTLPVQPVILQQKTPGMSMPIPQSGESLGNAGGFRGSPSHGMPT